MPRKANLKTNLNVPIIGIGTLFYVAFFCYWLLTAMTPTEFTKELFGKQRSGEKLFRVFLLDPIPSSVSILNSQDDGGFGDYILLHFKISPDDFDLILTSKKWEVYPPDIIGGYYSESEVPKELSWWSLRSLDKNAIGYYFNIGDGCDKEWQNIWINSQRNEVYFKVTFNCP
jgi:hypothetical protein